MDTTKKPVPKYGETVKNADGSIAGVAVFDPNTGKALAGAQQFNPNTGTAITADQLAPVQPLKLPENAPDTTASDFINRQIEGLNVSKEKSVIDTEAEKVATEKKTSIDALLAAMNDVGVVEDKQSQYEKEAGVDKFKKQRSEIQHAMEVESRVIKKNTDALLNDPTLTRGMALRMAGEAERISASKMADLAITEKAYGGLYQEALDIAKEKVEIQTKPLKRKVEKLEFAYNQNKDYFNDVQKAKLEGLIKTEDRKYNEEVKKKEDIEKYAITALQNGASQEVAKKIRESKTTGEAIEALGIYASDPLERKIKAAQLAKINQDISQDRVKFNERDSVTGGDIKPLSGEASKLLSISSGLQNNVKKIQNKIDAVGYEKFLRGYLLGTDRETVKLLSNSADQIGRLRSGGAINKDEEKRFLSQFASRGDYAFGNADIAKEALDSILTEATTVRTGIDPNNKYSTGSTLTSDEIVDTLEVPASVKAKKPFSTLLFSDLLNKKL